MGCDIHAHIEYESMPDWMEHFAAVDIDRSYHLFALMAGVRNRDNVLPVVEARGLPANLAKNTRYARRDRGGDAHHDSWLTADELEQVQRKYAETTDGNTNTEIAAIIAAMRVLGPTARLVFWFDN